MAADPPDDAEAIDVQALWDENKSLRERVARLERLFEIFDTFLERRIRHAVSEILHERYQRAWGEEDGDEAP